MEMIRCIYTSTVHAPVDSHEKIDFTLFDLRLLLCGSIQRGLLFRKPQNDPALVHRLETSLAATLRFFPQLAGRLLRLDSDDGTTASFSIDCNNAGAQFVHAVADSVSVSNIAGAVYVPQIVYSFFPDIGEFGHEGVSKPLMAAQVTELSDGVFIGCSMSHAVADGASFWHFVKSWSEISGGAGTISKLPLRRGIEAFGPVRIPLEQIRTNEASDGHAPPKFVERVYVFSKESTAELKAQANSEMGANRISNLQAVLAHLWRCVIRCRDQPNNGKLVRMKMIIGARLRWPLPEHYFGNAIVPATITMKAGDLVGENGVGQAAWEINKVVALHTQEKLKSILESWVEKSVAVNVVEPMTLDDILAVHSSPRFNVYDNDFGWGRPIAVRGGVGDKHVGTITLFPGVEQGSTEIHASLTLQTLHAMEKDLEFMDKVRN